MEQIVFFDKNNSDIGLQIRRTTEGVEIELVREFIDYYIAQFKKTNKKKNLAIFLEPRVESGFPDIVFAKFSSDIMDNWNDERKRLRTIDLKLLSQILYKQTI